MNDIRLNGSWRFLHHDETKCARMRVAIWTMAFLLPACINILALHTSVMNGLPGEKYHSSFEKKRLPAYGYGTVHIERGTHTNTRINEVIKKSNAEVYDKTNMEPNDILASILKHPELAQTLLDHYPATDPAKKMKTKRSVQIINSLQAMESVENDGQPIEIANHPYLYVGSVGAAYNLDALSKEGITHVVNLSPSIEPKYPGRVQYMHVNDIHDSTAAKHKISRLFEPTSTFIENARRSGGKVLVHCWRGKSRSVTVVTAYLMRYHGLTSDSALRLVTSSRSEADPNEGYRRELKEYQQHIQDHGQEEPTDTYLTQVYMAQQEGDRTVADVSNNFISTMKFSSLKRALINNIRCNASVGRLPAYFDDYKPIVVALKCLETVEDDGILANVPFSKVELLETYPCTSPDDLKDAGTEDQLAWSLEGMELVEIDGSPVQINGHPYLYVGSVGAAYNVSSLTKENITHIIDLSPSIYPRYKNLASYLHVLNVHDTTEVQDSLENYFESTSAFIEEARTSGGKVLVHCWRGRSRSVTTITAYLMKHHGMTKYSAIRLIKETRPQADPNYAYLMQLNSYGRFLRKSNQNKVHQVSQYSDGELSLERIPKDQSIVLKDNFLFHVPYSLFTDALNKMYGCTNLQDEDDEEGEYYQYACALLIMEFVEKDGAPIQILDHPYLYIGSIGAAYNLPSLEGADITHIINLSSLAHCRYPSRFEYLHLDVADDSKIVGKDRRHLDSALEYIEKVRKMRRGKVLVHGWEGENARAVAVAYLVKFHAMTPNSALKLVNVMRSKGNHTI